MSNNNNNNSSNRILFRNKHTEVKQDIVVDTVHLKAEPNTAMYGDNEEKIYIHFYQKHLLATLPKTGLLTNEQINTNPILKNNRSSIEIVFNSMGKEHVREVYDQIMDVIDANEFFLQVTDDSPPDDCEYGKLNFGSYPHGYTSFFIDYVNIKYMRRIKVSFRLSMDLKS